MLTALRDGARVTAWEVEKGAGPYSCPDPDCKNPDLILRKGRKLVHHFSHRARGVCRLGGESAQHAACKKAIYDAVKALGLHVELEYHLGRCRPDILIWGRQALVAVEVQLSALSIEEIIRRTQQYTLLGFYTLWVTPWQPKLTETRFRPTPWQLWAHAAYFGRVYYWTEGEMLVPAHFIRETKTYRRAVLANPVRVTHLYPTEREAWSGGDITVPKCRIMKDNYQKWWTSTANRKGLSARPRRP